MLFLVLFILSIILGLFLLWLFNDDRIDNVIYKEIKKEMNKEE